MPDKSKGEEFLKFKSFEYAHRGLHDNNINIVENSLEAFERAKNHGYGIELDVQLTKDKIPVVFHDQNLRRIVNLDKDLSDLNYSQLKKLKLSNTNYSIPSLKEVLELIDGKVPLIIEFKSFNHKDMTLLIKSMELLDYYSGDYMVESFNPLMVRWFRLNRPEIIRGQLSSNMKKKGKDFLKTLPLTYMLTNILSRPNFVAYNHLFKNNLTLIMLNLIFKSNLVAYTVTNYQDFLNNKKKFTIQIFEDFLP